MEKMKKLLLIVLMAMAVLALRAQVPPVMTLEYCLDEAVQNHPLSKQFGLLEQSTELKMKNIGKNYLPGMAVNGQMHYQSDVTKVPSKVPIPELQIEPIDKDWYKINFDVNQLIWDGGLTRHNKSLEAFNQLIEEQQVKMDLYELKEIVYRTYLNILLLQENRRLLDVYSKEIKNQAEEMDSRVRNGMVLQTMADVLQAELLKVHQKIIEVDVAIETSVKVLSRLIDNEIEEGILFQVPELMVELPENTQQRLEYGLFDYQQMKLEEMKKLSNASLLPRFFGFGQLGYGRPGYDMLNNNFDSYYMIGLRLNWNFWDWNKHSNEKTILELNKNIISTQREGLDRNLNIEIDKRLAEVFKIEQLIKKDQEIVELRIKITRTYASQMNNGVITATEYLTELKAETEARLDLEKHKLELIDAKLEYLATIGEL